MMKAERRRAVYEAKVVVMGATMFICERTPTSAASLLRAKLAPVALQSRPPDVLMRRTHNA